MGHGALRVAASTITRAGGAGGQTPKRDVPVARLEGESTVTRPNLVQRSVLALATSLLLATRPVAAHAAPTGEATLVAQAIATDERATLDWWDERYCRPRRCFELPFPPILPFPAGSGG
jgi:hypothetical protein